MALFHRDRPGGSGHGQIVDISLLEPLMCAVGPGPTVWDQLGVLQERFGNRSRATAPRNTYRTLDNKWVALSTSATSIAERVMTLVGRSDFVTTDWFHSAVGRAEHGDELDGAVADWISQRPLNEVIENFIAADAAIAPVYDAQDLSADPHVTATNMVTTVPDDDFGEIKMTNVLFRMSETPGSIQHTGRDFGADTDTILRELGIDETQVRALRERGLIA